MVDAEEYARWRAMADDAAALINVQRTAGADHWACFMAEQAAQFAVKALLHGLGAGGWGHDLVDLGERMEAALEDRLPSEARDALIRLSRHYIATRYPDAHAGGTPAAHYGPADAQQAMTDADVVLGFVQSRWSLLVGES